MEDILSKINFSEAEFFYKSPDAFVDYSNMQSFSLIKSTVDVFVYYGIRDFAAEDITSDTRILRVDLLDPETPIGGAVFDILVVPAGGIVKGDVTGEGEVSADDLTALSRYVAQIETGWSQTKLAAADVTGDGEVDANDLTLLSRYVAGIITTWE